MIPKFTSTDIVSAARFDGKRIDYLVELSVEAVNESQYRITTFSTQEVEMNKTYSEIVHDLRGENIIYSSDKINKLTHKDNNVRPIRIDKIDVYSIIYESKPGWVEEANIPCKLIEAAIKKIPKSEIKVENRGRHKKYSTEVARKEAQQCHALLHHYRKEALENYLKSNPHDEIITVKVNVSSKVLGEFNEEISYKRLQDGSYRKVHQ